MVEMGWKCRSQALPGIEISVPEGYKLIATSFLQTRLTEQEIHVPTHYRDGVAHG
jgi:hypothetical protein